MSSSGVRRSGDQLRSELLAAAERLLSEKLEVRVPALREIARECRVSATAVYRYFASQDELTDAIIHRQWRSLLDELLAVSDAVAPGERQTLIDLGVMYVRWGLRQPGAYQLIFDAGRPRTEAADFGTEIADLQRRLVDLCAPLAPGRSDLAEHALRFWIGLHGITTVRFRDSSWTAAQTVEADVAALVEVYFPPPAGSR